MGVGRPVSRVKEKLMNILQRQIRPYLADPHPDRRERYRMYEVIIVELMRMPPGDEAENLWLQIQDLSYVEPWGSGLRLSMRFGPRPKYLVKSEPFRGQLGWDFSHTIEYEEPEESSLGDREVHLAILKDLLRNPSPNESEATRHQRYKLLFLVDLYRTLCDQA